MKIQSYNSCATFHGTKENISRNDCKITYINDNKMGHFASTKKTSNNIGQESTNAANSQIHRIHFRIP